MILGYIVGDFSIMSRIVYTPPPSPQKRNWSWTAKRTGIAISCSQKRSCGEGERCPSSRAGWREGVGTREWEGSWMRLLLLMCGAWTLSSMPSSIPDTVRPFLVLCCDIPTLGKGGPSPNIRYYFLPGECGALSSLGLDLQRWLWVCVIWSWSFSFSIRLS